MTRPTRLRFGGRRDDKETRDDLASFLDRLGVDSALTRSNRPRPDTTWVDSVDSTESRPSQSKLEAQGDSRLGLVTTPAESETTRPGHLRLV